MTQKYLVVLDTVQSGLFPCKITACDVIDFMVSEFGKEGHSLYGLLANGHVSKQSTFLITLTRFSGPHPLLTDIYYALNVLSMLCMCVYMGHDQVDASN